jgi:hypothetical protein
VVLQEIPPQANQTVSLFGEKEKETEVVNLGTSGPFNQTSGEENEDFKPKHASNFEYSPVLV